MIEKKLKIDLSPLWNEEIGTFTIRFLNINEKEKRILAQRIKDVAKQARIRSLRGPNIQDIYETLMEINPIIFGEYNQNYIHRTINGYKTFNKTNSRTLDGYFFHELCKAIYLINCLKRDLNKQEINSIAYLTCQSWDKVIHYTDQHYQTRHEEEIERRNIIEDIGIDDIKRAREHAEENGADRIPDGVFTREPENNEEENNQFSVIETGILNEIIDERQIPTMRTFEGITFEERTFRTNEFEEATREIPGRQINRERHTRGSNLYIDRAITEIQELELQQEGVERIPNPYAIGSANWRELEESKIVRIRTIRDRINHLNHEINQRNLEQNPNNRFVEDFRIETQQIVPAQIPNERETIRYSPTIRLTPNRYNTNRVYDPFNNDN